MIELLNNWGQTWSEQFGLIVLQNSVFLGLIIVVLACLRTASARLRHAVALVGLLKLITPPLFPLGTTTVAGYLVLTPVVSNALQLSLGGTAASVDGHVSLTLSGALFATWSVVALGVLAHAFAINLGLYLELRHRGAVDDADAQHFEQATGVRVCLVDRAAVPMTIGILPRTVFVPREWSTWSSCQRSCVLRHELAHIQRRDGLVRVVETLVRSLYWFHPLALSLIHRLDLYREQACDEAVVADQPHSRLAYSQFLVQMAESLMHGNAIRGEPSAMVRKSTGLSGRIRHLLREEPIMSLSKTRAILVGIALSGAILSLSWYYSSANPKATPSAHDEIGVALTADDQVIVAGKETALESLGAMLAEQVGNRDAIVRIECGPEVPMYKVFQAHAALRGAGLLKVSYAQSGGGVVPLVLPSEELIEKAKSYPAEHVVHLVIRSTGSCALDGVELEPSDISDMIARRLAKDHKLVVSVRMEESATFGQYIFALQALKAAGANRIFIEEPARL